MVKKRKRQKSATPVSVASSSERTGEYLIIGMILVVSSILILSNLASSYLWQDEAQTACIAKTILTHGVPLGFDGKNHFSQTNGAEYGRHYIWRWHTWLPFYVLAGFFRVFGTSTFVCRLPFALFGIATVLLTYFFAGSLWGSRRARVLAAVLLTMNVPFLLLARQCRYYSMTAFFAMAGLYAYREMLRGRKGAPTAFVLSLLLLFHTFYVYVPALLAAVIVHTVLFRRDRLRLVLATSAAAALLNLPWMIYFASVYGSAHPKMGLLSRTLILFNNFLIQCFWYVITPWLLLTVVAGAWIWLRKGRPPTMDSETRQNGSLLVLFVIAVVLVLAPTSPDSFFRYLAPVIPALVLITARILDSTMKVSVLLGLLIVVLMPFSHITHSYVLGDYLYEITHEYRGGVEGIVKYLNAHAGKNDVVVTNREDLPIKFYTDLRVISGVSGEDYRPGKDANWVIIRRHVTPDEQGITDYLFSHVRKDMYEQTLLDYPDLVYENREDLVNHLFRTNTDEPSIVMFHRKGVRAGWRP